MIFGTDFVSILAALGSVIGLLLSVAVFGVISTEISRSVSKIEIGWFGIRLAVAKDDEAGPVHDDRGLGAETLDLDGSATSPTWTEDEPVEPARTQTASAQERNLALLEQYHAHGLTQSKTSFRFSLLFAALGFLMIAVTVANVAFAKNTSLTGANIVSLLGGTVIEAVSALFFVQSNRARHLMSAFFDRLRTDRALEEALKLSDDIPDPLIRSRLKTVLSLTLAGSRVSDDVMRGVMADTPDEDALRRGARPSVVADESPEMP